MYKKTVLIGLVLAFLLSFVLAALFITPVAASPAIRRVPTEYPTIQAAINAASNGDTIQVASGIYYEHVVVNKSLTLVGENSRTTVIDGSGTGIVVRITVSNVEIRGFTVRNDMYSIGIWVYGLGGTISGTTIEGNIISNNYIGIDVFHSDNSVISGNTITDNQYGIKLHISSGNIVGNNTVSSNSFYGIYLFSSDNNKIVGNMISYNNRYNFDACRTYGVYIGTCSGNNILYHNNFVSNTIQAYDEGTNTWDNGYPSGGNYWSDYSGADEKSGPNQNQLGSDGIGDTPYVIDSDNKDNYPLMYPYSIILIDEAYVSGDRVDVGSVQTVGFHAKWSYEGSDVVGCSIYVNETKYVTDQTGWISFNTSYNTVGKRSWTVTSASFNGITSYKQVVSDPSIIWDRIRFTLDVAHYRVDVNSSAPISWTGIYEYDGNPFTGSVSFNDTTVKESVGKYGYGVKNMLDLDYGLTEFVSNFVSVIFDRLEVYGHGVTDTRCDVGSSQRVWVKVRYDYDDVIFDDSMGSISIGGISATWNATKNYWYIIVSQDAVTKINYSSPSNFTDNIYNLTVISGSVTQSIIWDRINITLSVEDDRIDVGSTVSINCTGIYEYDGTPFRGAFSFNETIVKRRVGKYGYGVKNMLDLDYGLTEFVSNFVSVIFDRVAIELSVADSRIDVGATVAIEWNGIYEYDGSEFTGEVRFNGTLTKDVVGKYWYMVKSIDDPYGITVFETNVVSCIFDKVTIVLSVADDMISVGSTADIGWMAVYEYDDTEYDGVVALNGTLTKLEAGRYGYTVSGISGDTHGITAFESNSVYVIFEGEVPEEVVEEEAGFPLWVVGVLVGLVVLLTLATFFVWRRRKPKSSSTA